MTQDTRKHFEEWKVHYAFMQQEGRCKQCGGTLDYGIGTGKKYEKHHANGDHSNNKVENLELLCKSCHMATLAKTDKDYEGRYKKYLEKKTEIFNQLINLTEKAMNKELAGTVISSTIELVNMEQKALAEEYNMNEGVFYPPPSIKSMIYIKNMKNELEAMKEGIRIGMSSLVDILKEKKE